MPETAIQTSPVSTMVIKMKERMSLEQLLLAAKIEDDDGTAMYAWTLTDRTIDRPVKLHGVEVRFFPCPERGRLIDHMKQVLWDEKMMAVSAYEIFCLAASNPDAFQEVLRIGSIVVPTPEKEKSSSPFMLIRLVEGRIQLSRWEHWSDFQSCQFAGVCFTPTGE